MYELNLSTCATYKLNDLRPAVMTFLSWFGRGAQQKLFLSVVDTQWDEGCAGAWHGHGLTIGVSSDGQQPCSPQSSLLWGDQLWVTCPTGSTPGGGHESLWEGLQQCLRQKNQSMWVCPFGCLSASPDVPHTSKKKALFSPLWSLGEAGPGGWRKDWTVMSLRLCAP